MAPVFSISGRIALAAAIKASTAHHLAWGSGNTAWGSNPPAPPANSTALLAEVGRRRATAVEFCTPDVNGPISVTEGKFSTTNTPTQNLYFKFHFDFEDGVGSTIREMAIFLNTVLAAGVPSGQFYLAPSQVAQSGSLLVIERRAPIIREITTRQLFEFVVTF
jgi:hypothetical protein